MRKKTGFSMLELIIVIAIIGILFVSFRGYFQLKNKNILYGQSCIENIYGQINNFVYAGISSKSIFSGTQQIFPDYYSIVFDTINQNIILQYKQKETLGIYTKIPLIGGIDTHYCKDKDYKVIMTGTTYEVIINKGLQENQNLQSFFISGSIIQHTGETIFFQCNSSETLCQKIAIIETDTRTISINKKICLGWDNTGECLEWDK